MSYIHVIRHRLYKSVLFLIAGYILIYNSGNQDIRSISSPLRLILVLTLIISNLGGMFMFTISTEHLFKVLTIPTHMFVIPMLTLRVFFLFKITIKLIDVLATNNIVYVVRAKIKGRFYFLIVPIIICIFGDIYFCKVQPMVSYELWINNIIYFLMIFAIPINIIHNKEINMFAPIRLDQE